MKKWIGIALLLMVSTSFSAETNPPTWSAKYWASTNGFTGSLSVKPSFSDSYMIYTNGISTGVLTKDIDQDAVAAFKNSQNKPVSVLMLITPSGDLIPAHTNRVWKLPDENEFKVGKVDSKEIVINNHKAVDDADLKEKTYDRPRDLLLYYGYLNSFNSATHGWNNEKVAQEMAQYSLFVFGNGVTDPTHPDYNNATQIIHRVKALNPNGLIFGYVAATETYENFVTKADQVNAVDADGVFIDSAGYDYGVNRSNFNVRVDYIHGLSDANMAFANAWNTDHILGTNNDASYPNATWNPNLLQSSLQAEQDWVLMESFPVNTTAWGDGGYEGKAEWYSRAAKMVTLRNEYDIKFAGCIVINNANVNGQGLFDFGFVSAMMWCLDAFGSSDTAYGASTAQVKWWDRPDITSMGKIWDVAPATLEDKNDADVYMRYSGCGQLKLDFSTGAQTNSITKW